MGWTMVKLYFATQFARKPSQTKLSPLRGSQALYATDFQDKYLQIHTVWCLNHLNSLLFHIPPTYFHILPHAVCWAPFIAWSSVIMLSFFSETALGWLRFTFARWFGHVPLDGAPNPLGFTTGEYCDVAQSDAIGCPSVKVASATGTRCPDAGQLKANMRTTRFV